MPKGIPVATFAIGEAGAINAALFAVSMLALQDSEMQQKLDEFRESQTQGAMNMIVPPEKGE